MRSETKRIALGGVLAAFGVVIMCLGGFIPIATYVCPMLCCMTEFIVMRFCGKRIAWTWFCVVSLLSIIMSPDKEAVLVFIAVGYYPILKPVIERSKLTFVLKLLYFNSSILAAYAIMIRLLGMQEIAVENAELGMIGLATIIILGNVTFLLLDRLLSIMEARFR